MKTKNILFILSISLTVIAGCENGMDNMMNIPQQEEELNLLAPNGEQIAIDLKELQNKTALFVAKQFGDDYVFSITDIEYADVTDGYLAIVNYRLKDGRVSNYALSNSPSVLQASEIDELVMTNRQIGDITYNETSEEAYLATTRTAEAGGNISFVCKSASGCKPCQVKMQITHDDVEPTPSADYIKISCDDDKCPDCKLETIIN